jgi:uncharacterized protein
MRRTLSHIKFAGQGPTMRIIRHSELTATPWKNGGGVTREIAAVRRGEAVVWRLSMADVTSDGPFSNFGGLIRILTVIEGNGMELIGAAGTLYADYGRPVRFDGGLVIRSRLIDGPLRDLNLMFAPLFCDGQVVPLEGPHCRALRANPELHYALHGMRGEVALGDATTLHAGDTALFEEGSVHVDLTKGAAALLIILEKPAHTDASKPATATR